MRCGSALSTAEYRRARRRLVRLTAEVLAATPETPAEHPVDRSAGKGGPAPPPENKVCQSADPTSAIGLLLAATRFGPRRAEASGTAEIESVLRHTFASHLAMRGVPLKVIQELLGHASIVNTMIYAHLTPHVARDAVRVLDRARSREPAPNSAPTSSPPPAIPVDVATDWRKPPDRPVTN